MLRITLQQTKLLVGAISYLQRERLICPPEAFRGAVFHSPRADGLFRAFHSPARFAQPRPVGPPPDPPRCGDRAVSAPRTHRATAAVPPTPLASAFRSRARSLRPFFRSCPAPARNFSL